MRNSIFIKNTDNLYWLKRYYTFVKCFTVKLSPYIFTAAVFEYLKLRRVSNG